MILVAPRGYCAGVDRAVATVERALEKYGQVYVRKQIVHNKHVVNRLRDKGAIFVDEIDEVPRGAVVVFSAHGVSPAVRAAAASRGLVTIDATCPLVTKVHKQAQRLADAGTEILLIGHEGHEEVEGTFGEAPDAIRLIEHPSDVDRIVVRPNVRTHAEQTETGTGNLAGERSETADPAPSDETGDPTDPATDQIIVRDPHRVAWLSQTTLSVDETRDTVARLRARIPDLIDPPSEDICYATQNRQSAVREVARQCDCVIVVGSANSSNSRRLVEVAHDAGAGQAYLIDDVDQIDPTWLVDARTIGVTSGASVPEHLVEDVVDHLRSVGFDDVVEHESVSETLTFALPPQVR